MSMETYLLNLMFQGEYKITNMTFKGDGFLSVYPSGYYKTEIWMHDDTDDLIFKIIYFTTVKSVLIESF